MDKFLRKFGNTYPATQYHNPEGRSAGLTAVKTSKLVMIRVTCSFVYLAKLYQVHIGPVIQCHVRPVTKSSNDDDDDDDAKEVSSRAIKYTERFAGLCIKFKNLLLV